MMDKNEIIERLGEIAKHAVHIIGEEPFIMSLDDGTAVYEAIDIIQQSQPQRTGQWIPCTKNGLPLSEMAYRDGQKWYGYKCSNCNFIYKGNALTESPYCKKCGARMEESGK